MNTLSKLIFAIFLIAMIPTTHAQQSEGYYPTYTEADALQYMDFYDSYGNRGIQIDKESMSILVRHNHIDGYNSYKGFRVEVKKPEDHILEFHLLHEAENELSDKLNRSLNYYDKAKRRLDLEKAYDKFMRFHPPHDHYGADIKGGHLIYSDKHIRLTDDIKTHKIIKMEQFTIEETDEGIIYRVETTIPAEPIEPEWLDRLKSKDVEEDDVLIDNPIQSLQDDPPLAAHYRWCSWDWSEFKRYIGGSADVDFGDSISNRLSTVESRVNGNFIVGRWLWSYDCTLVLELTNELYYRPDTIYASTLIDTRHDEDRADAAFVFRSRLDVTTWTQNWGYTPQMGLYENELTLELDITGEYVDENIPDQIRRGIDERGCSTSAGYRLTHRVYGPPGYYRESFQSEDESDLTGNR